MEVHKRLKSMSNDVCVLKPIGKAEADKELLLELLKESRKVLLKRVAEQSRKLVELRCAYNELLAKVNGVGEEDCQDKEHLLEHVRDMEENARKMKDAMTHLEEDLCKTTEEKNKLSVKINELDMALHHRTGDVEQLQKSLEKAMSEIGAEKTRSGELLHELESIRAKDGKSADDDVVSGLKETIKELRRDKAALNKELKTLKRDVAMLTDKSDMYETMCKYGKLQGVKYRRLSVMKKAVKEAEAKDKSLTEIFKGIVDDGGVGTQEVSEIGQGEEGSSVMNSEDYSDAVAMDKQECPWGVEQIKGKTAIVGGRYCRHSCPYNEGVNEDENFVHCSKKSSVK